MDKNSFSVDVAVDAEDAAFEAGVFGGVLAVGVVALFVLATVVMAMPRCIGLRRSGRFHVQRGCGAVWGEKTLEKFLAIGRRFTAPFSCGPPFKT
jgi:hypothetical protein